MTAKFRFDRGRFFTDTAALFSSERHRSALTALPLLFGVAAGSVIGLYSRTIPAVLFSVPLLSYAEAPDGFFQVLVRSLPFAAAAFAFSTGYLGVFFIPILSLFRGFVFGCAVAALFSADGYSGLLQGLILIGIPSLFCIPAFLLIATDSFRLSRMLLPFGRTIRYSVSPKSLVYHAAAVVLLFSVEALYFCCCLPLIFEKIYF